MNSILPLFSTPIYQSNLEILDSESSYIKNLSYTRYESNTGWQSDDTYVLESKELEGLKNKVLDHIKSYINDGLSVKEKYDFYIANSWVTIHKMGDFSPEHTHHNSLFSGTCYINIPEDDDSSFAVKSPYEFNIFPCMVQPELKEYNLFNSKSWYLKPHTGSIYLFPSTLYHFTTQCTSNNPRYCLAFNIGIKGEFSGGSSKTSTIDKLIIK